MFMFAFMLVGLALAADFSEKEAEQLRQHHHHSYNGQDILVHVVPHSHDDVGWLKTVDEYFYGGAQNIQYAAVQHTIDSVVDELAEHEEYKFVQVEMAFLYRWWHQATPQQQQTLKKLVQDGQFQFLNAGWCMSDEATVYYEDFIDQMTLGLKWLKDTFNYVPDVAWHIDPFGHQAAAASMLAQMGFQTFFFARIDYQDKEKRLDEKEMEMIWRPSAQPDDYIFSHVLYYLYRSPPGYCFDNRCPLEEPIKDDPTLQNYDLVDRVEELVKYFKSMATHYRTTNLMHNFGGDFQYSNARMYFKNIDKLMKYINERPEYGVKMQYSTPNAYIDAIRNEGVNYPTKSDDFLPYADEEHGYWTGFFTSRTAVKGFVRDFGRWLQAVRKHVAELKLSSAFFGDQAALEKGIWEMETAMGILQHHDAVSGTEKQRIANDYIYTATKAIDEFSTAYRKVIKEEISSESGESPLENSIRFNIYWNETGEDTGVNEVLKKGRTVLLSLYNPGPAKRRQIRIGVPKMDLKVVDQNNSMVEGDVMCSDVEDGDNCQLVFWIDMRESGNSYIKLISGTSPSARVVSLQPITDSVKEFKLSDSAKVRASPSEKFELEIQGVGEKFSLTYNYYESYQDDGQKSGAYIFRPATNTPQQFSHLTSVHYAEGLKEVVVVMEGSSANAKLRFSKEPNYVDYSGFVMQTFLKGIPVDDGKGKQVTLSLQTDYNNNHTFNTDSCGLQEQKRILNYRPSWNLTLSEPVAGNFYPINSHITIQDVESHKRVTVLPDRSQGATLLQNGLFQFMIHRRLLFDDDRGVNQTLNETEPDGSGLKQRMRHYVVLGNNYREIQQQNDQKVRIAISESSSGPFFKVNLRNCPIQVPKGVKLYLHPFNDHSYLLRVQNFNEKQTFVTLPNFISATETTLSANQNLSTWKSKRYQWNEQSSEKTGYWLEEGIKFIENVWKSLGKNSEQQQNSSIQLNFMEIRTFIIQRNI